MGLSGLFSGNIDTGVFSLFVSSSVMDSQEKGTILPNRDGEECGIIGTEARIYGQYAVTEDTVILFKTNRFA